MMEYVNLQLLKKKFATMISKLNTNAGISAENISDRIISNEFFDFAERQEIEMFMHTSYEDMSRQLFGCDFTFDEDDNVILYWAGIQYMNICINRQMPLRQVVLLCPIEEMAAHFSIYHEMNDAYMVQEYCDNEYRRSILRALRKRSGFTVSTLGALTSIPANTIKYYEKDNRNLFGASFANIRQLSDVLEVPESVFAKKSLFAAYSRSLLEDECFMELLRREFESIYSKTIREIDCNDGLIRIKFKSSGKHMFVPQLHIKKAWQNAFVRFSETEKTRLLI